jgi:hypothetical protein
LAYAYFYAGAENLKNPPVHAGQFFKETKKIFMVPFGMESRLWKEKDIDISQFENIDRPIEAPDSLNGILAYLDTILKDVHVEGFMRDELFCRRGEMDDEGFNHVLDRLFPEGEPDFESPYQKQLFLKLCRNLWNKTGKSYNYFADQDSGKLRGEAVAIFEDFIAWFCSYIERFSGINEKDIPLQEITRLVQSTDALTEMLRVLNTAKWAGKSSELDDIEKILPLIKNKLVEERQKLEMKTAALQSSKKTKGGNRNLTLVKPEERGDHNEYNETEGTEVENVFVLRVSIKDIKPPIWRSIQAPGSYTLGDLHRIIQIVMGWDMSHLHVFEIYRKQYGPQDESYDDDIYDYDEEDYTLDSLGLNEKDKFSYVYDFGDEWDHQILVSKIIPASQTAPIDRIEALCLKGKRACPPEDIGGVYGYERLLEQLGHKKLDSEMEWLEGYDSEYFNIDEINKRLRQSSYSGDKNQ